MKFILPVFVAFSFYSAFSFGCDDISGKYQSTDPKIGTRVYTIQQNGCNYTLQLNNAGALLAPDQVKADNVAYDRSQSNYGDKGGIVDFFRPLAANSTGYFRAYQVGAALYLNDIKAWSGKAPLSTCKEQFVLQDNCGFLQIVLTKNTDGSLLETQNGYAYFGGNHHPYYIHYRRIQ